MGKKVLAYSHDFQRMFFNKDLFLIPYYVAKEKGLPLEFCYGYNMGDKEIPNEYRGATMRTTHRKSVTTLGEILDSVKFILFQARKIDTIFVVGISFIHLLRIYLFKILNPSGNVLIFGDMEPEQADDIVKTDFYKSHGISGIIKQWLADYCFRNSKLLVANTSSYKKMLQIYESRGWKGLLHFYPCLDDEKFNEFGMVRKPWEEKENIMVCVGRIGCYQKNTEMLLEALKSIDLKDWKIYMIGPITNSFALNENGDFQKVIDKFFEECPQHKDKLIFTGIIYDKKEIFDYYNRAKILLSTSRHEGFANTYSEAAAFGCYVISTDVGGADVGSNNWQFGTKIEQEEAKMFASTLNDILDERKKIDITKSLSLHDISYSYKVNNGLLLKMGL